METKKKVLKDKKYNLEEVKAQKAEKKKQLFNNETIKKCQKSSLK